MSSLTPVAWMWRCPKFCAEQGWHVSKRRPVDAKELKSESYEDYPLYSIPDTHRVVSVADLKLLLSFAPGEKPEDVPEGLNPMLYFTLTHDGDKSIAERLKRIRAIIDNKGAE